MREPMNHELLTEDELAMPMGAGYPTAAKRLGLIYLADVVTLAHIVVRHMEEALQLAQDYAAGHYSSDQVDRGMVELTDRLSEILSGRNPRYMATPWFTDRTQLAHRIFMSHAGFYQSECDASDITKLRLDPIREEAFLIITTAFDNDFNDELTIERYVTLSVRELLNIPEVVPLDMLRMSRSTRATIQFQLAQPESTRE